MAEKKYMGTADPFAYRPERKLDDALAALYEAGENVAKRERRTRKRQKFLTDRMVEGTKAAEEAA